MSIRECAVGTILLFLASLPAGAPAQETPPAGGGAFESLGDFGGLGDFDGLGMDAGDGELELTGSFSIVEGSRQGVLKITAKLSSGWHTYAMDQKGGPGPAEIIVRAEGLELKGPFTPDHPPEVRTVEYFEVPLREHYGEVTWSAPIELAADADPQAIKIDAKFNGQICEDSTGCRPIFDQPIEVRFAGYSAPPSVSHEFRAERSHVTVSGSLHPAVVRPGEALTLSVIAAPDEGWHVYAWAEKDPLEISKPTLIVIDSPSGWACQPPNASTNPVEKQVLPDSPPVRYHEGAVTWTVPIQVPQDATAGEQQIGGVVGYQACTESSCDRPLGTRFTATVTVGDALTDESAALIFEAASYSEASEAADAASLDQGPAPAVEDVVSVDTEPETGGATATVSDATESASPLRPKIDFWNEMYKRLSFQETPQGWSHRWFPSVTLNATTLKTTAVLLALVASWLGGLILNIMPCVLPVIGLKLMSFVRQAGEDRWRVFSLNVWYAVGIWAVFMVFAIIAAVLHVLGGTLSWGEHMGDPRISIPLLMLVFTLGLSLFGVWEIMLPGFVGGGATGDLAQKEGVAGAFFKGVLTTILATPCSGPFIGVAIGIAVIAPLWLNFAMFTVMGLGMASPYLLIGAFPKLIKWLPKPGEWMETFKQLMGFVLMGTSVWILSILEQRFLIPVLALSVGVGAACWIIGRTPFGAEWSRRLRNWIWGAVFVASGVLLFSVLLPPPDDATAATQYRPSDDSPELPWEPYTPDLLQSYRDKQATVLVDFTADWCLTCKTNEAVALNTHATKQIVLEHNIVTIKADKTHRRTADPVNELLVQLGNYGKTIPYVAIYPAGQDQPILLENLITQEQVIAALEKAVGLSDGVAQKEPSQ